MTNEDCKILKPDDQLVVTADKGIEIFDILGPDLFIEKGEIVTFVSPVKFLADTIKVRTSITNEEVYIDIKDVELITCRCNVGVSGCTCGAFQAEMLAKS